jgi:hypothetical protein
MTSPSTIVAPRSTLIGPTFGGVNVRRNDGTVVAGVHIAGGVIEALAAAGTPRATRPAATAAEGFRSLISR